MSSDYENLIKFFEKSSHKEIITNLPKILTSMTDFCDKNLGSGAMGTVHERKFGETIDLMIHQTIIKFPIVVKRPNNIGTFRMILVEDYLFLISNFNIIVEAIILYYLSDLWYKGKTPHVPFMIAMNKCYPEPEVLVDLLITEKCGLNETINIEFDGFMQPFFNLPYWKIPALQTSLATVMDLIDFCIKFQKNDMITLPNGIECNIVELFDNILISFLHTAYFIFKECKVTLSDMHSRNILIYWLGENSWMADMNLSEIKNIVYKTKSKLLQINTFGFIIKIGDVGTCIMTPKPKLYLIGQMTREPDPAYMDYYDKQNSEYTDFIFSLMKALPYKLFTKTLAGKIMASHPFNQLRLFSDGVNSSLGLPTPEALLETDLFSDYHIKNIIDNKSTLII